MGRVFQLGWARIEEREKMAICEEGKVGSAQGLLDDLGSYKEL